MERADQVRLWHARRLRHCEGSRRSACLRNGARQGACRVASRKRTEGRAETISRGCAKNTAWSSTRASRRCSNRSRKSMCHCNDAGSSICPAHAGRLLMQSWLRSPGAAAHEVRPAYLELREETPGVFSVLLKTPMQGDARLALSAAFSGKVEALSPVVVAPDRKRHGADLAGPRRRAVGGPDSVDRRPAEPR